MVRIMVLMPQVLVLMRLVNFDYFHFYKKYYYIIITTLTVLTFEIFAFLVIFAKVYM